MGLKITYDVDAEWLKEVAALSNTKTSEIVVKIPLKDNIVRTKNYYPLDLLSEMIITNIKPKPDFELSSVTTKDHKIITIRVIKGENGPYYFIANKKPELYVKKDKELVKLDLEDFLTLIPKDYKCDVLDYDYLYGNFNYFEKKYNAVFKKDPDFEKTYLLNNGKLTYAGYCFSETINNYIVVTCRKYKGRHIFSKIRRAVYTDKYMGDLVSILEKMLKFVKEFNHVQRVDVDSYPTVVRDYPYELFNKAVVNSLLDHDFTKTKEIILDIYDDKMLLFSRKDNNRPDKKIMLSFFSQFGLINLDNYYKDDETLIRENENYIIDYVEDVYVEEDLGKAVVKVFTNYNFRNLQHIPEYPKSTLEITHWLDIKVINLIRENCENTISYMADILRVRESSIKRSVKRLTQAGYIFQVGNGYFKIL